MVFRQSFATVKLSMSFKKTIGLPKSILGKEKTLQ
jgi:hypothetical protein